MIRWTSRRTALLATVTLGLVAPSAAALAQAQAEEDADIVYEVLAEGVNEPTQIEVTPDGRVVWAERDGTIGVISPGGVRTVAAELAPSGNLCETCTPEPDYYMPYDDPAGNLANGDPTPDRPNRTGAGGLEEGGLHGLLLDDDFADNNTLYVYYSAPNTRREVAPGVYFGDFHLSSLVLDPATNLIDRSTEEILLTVPAEWDHCCHYGGDIDYLPDGTLLLTTGDDVDASSSGGWGARDVTAHWLNAELTAANPADRRGKVLRLREDGTVPDGTVDGEVPNPFIGMEGFNPYIEDSPGSPWVGELAGTPGDGWMQFDPYVYAMGFKQPWRTAVMPNGDAWVGEVGPDAGVDDPERGPRGFEEVNRVPMGGGTHHGWPRCQGPNWAYVDVDWESMEAGAPLDCSETAMIARPIGATEPTVTGMTGADLYYPNGVCDGSQDESTTYDCNRWPSLGSGGKTSEPSFYYPPDQEGALALPERYRNRLWLMEWSRRFIVTIPADPTTGLLDLTDETFDLVIPPASSISPSTDQPQSSASVMQGGWMAPIDAEIGPDGAVYVVEYGAFFFAGENGRVSRVRAADAQLEAGANYGLPVTPVDVAQAAAAPAPTRSTALVVIGLVVALAVAARRRHLVAA